MENTRTFSTAGREVLHGELSPRSVIALTALVREALEDETDAHIFLARAVAELATFRPAPRL